MPGRALVDRQLDPKRASPVIYKIYTIVPRSCHLAALDLPPPHHLVKLANLKRPRMRFAKLR